MMPIIIRVIIRLFIKMNRIIEGHPDHCSLCKKRCDAANKRAEAKERFMAVRKEPEIETNNQEPEIDCLHWFEAGFLFGD